MEKTEEIRNKARAILKNILENLYTNEEEKYRGMNVNIAQHFMMW